MFNRRSLSGLAGELGEAVAVGGGGGGAEVENLAVGADEEELNRMHDVRHARPVGKLDDSRIVRVDRDSKLEAFAHHSRSLALCARQERPAVGIDPESGGVGRQLCGGVADGIDADADELDIGALEFVIDLEHVACHRRAGREAVGEDKAQDGDPAFEDGVIDSLTVLVEKRELRDAVAFEAGAGGEDLGVGCRVGGDDGRVELGGGDRDLDTFADFLPLDLLVGTIHPDHHDDSHEGEGRDEDEEGDDPAFHGVGSLCVDIRTAGRPGRV